RTHQEWCNKNNDPCDPEVVDSRLEAEVAVNDSENALAFVISYKHDQDFEGPVQRPDGPAAVAYVYRNVNDEAKLDYREVLLSELEKRFGKVPLRSLLESSALRKIFGGS